MALHDWVFNYQKGRHPSKCSSSWLHRRPDGPTYTSEVADPDAADGEIAAAHRLCRLGDPREIAAAALWLASDASSFATGAEFRSRVLPD
jgi:NAD(P)-dependent dehydrogenase (short-subunit alcohol dehydrogenase family)